MVFFSVKALCLPEKNQVKIRLKAASYLMFYQKLDAAKNPRYNAASHITGLDCVRKDRARTSEKMA